MFGIRVIALSTALAAALALSIATPSRGQPPSPGVAKEAGVQKDLDRERWSYGMTSLRDSVETSGLSKLLDHPRVVEVLRLTEKQRAFILERMNNTKLAKMKAVPATNSREELFATLQSIGDRMELEDEAAILQVLSTAQKRRWIEIGIQVEGPISLASPAVHEALNLSPETGQLAREIVLGYRRSKRELIQQMVNVSNAIVKGKTYRADPGKYSVLLSDKNKELDRLNLPIERLRADTHRELLRLLTRRQRETLKRLEGEPFDRAEEMKKPGSSTSAFQKRKEDDRVAGTKPQVRVESKPFEEARVKPEEAAEMKSGKDTPSPPK